VFNILKVGLITKSALDTNMNTKVMLAVLAVNSIRTVWSVLTGDCHKLLYCRDKMKAVVLVPVISAIPMLLNANFDFQVCSNVNVNAIGL